MKTKNKYILKRSLQDLKIFFRKLDFSKRIQDYIKFRKENKKSESTIGRMQRQIGNTAVNVSNTVLNPMNWNKSPEPKKLLNINTLKNAQKSRHYAKTC